MQIKDFRISVMVFKERTITIICAIFALCTLAHGQNTEHMTQSLWVIDGVMVDFTIPINDDEFFADSIETYLNRHFPIIKPDDVKEIRIRTTVECTDILCINEAPVIVINTREDRWIQDLELNGIYTKKKKIALGDFAGLTNRKYLDKWLEKIWKIKNIKSIQFHPDGKTVLDKKGRPHQVRLSIVTE